MPEMNNKNLELTTDLAYLIGVIIGDGHLTNSTKSKIDLSPDYGIKIDVSDKNFLYAVFKIIKNITNTKSTPKKTKIYGNRKQRYYIQVRNKKLFSFLLDEMEIPKGNKSSIVIIPQKISTSNEAIKKHFLSGLFDTDGGFRGGSLGFTSASKELIEGISQLLVEFDINHFKDNWTNKKYDKEAFGIRISKKEIDKFLNILKFRNIEKLERILKRFYEEVPEWSNGIESSYDDVQA